MSSNLTSCWHDSCPGNYNQETLAWKAVYFVVNIISALNLKDDIILLFDSLAVAYKMSKEADQPSSSIMSNILGLLCNVKELNVINNFCYLPHMYNNLGCKLLKIGLSKGSRRVWCPSPRDSLYKINPSIYYFA